MAAADILDNLLLQEDGSAILLGNGVDRLLLGQLSVPGPPANEITLIVPSANAALVFRVVGSIIVELDASNPVRLVDPMTVLKTGGPNSKTVVTVEFD